MQHSGTPPWGEKLSEAHNVGGEPPRVSGEDRRVLFLYEVRDTVGEASGVEKEGREERGALSAIKVRLGCKGRACPARLRVL